MFTFAASRSIAVAPFSLEHDVSRKPEQAIKIADCNLSLILFYLGERG